MVRVLQEMHLADLSRKARSNAMLSALHFEQSSLQSAIISLTEDTDILMNSFLGEQQKACAYKHFIHGVLTTVDC
jgi:hypothetical protein